MGRSGHIRTRPPVRPAPQQIPQKTTIRAASSNPSSLCPSLSLRLLSLTLSDPIHHDEQLQQRPARSSTTRRRWPSVLRWSGPRWRPATAPDLEHRLTSRAGAVRTPELDPPGPRAAMPGQHSPRRPRVVSFPRWPLLHAASAGCLCPRLRPACALRSRRRAPRAARGSVHGRGRRRSSPRATAPGRSRTPTRTRVSSPGCTAAPSRRRRRTLVALTEKCQGALASY